MTHEWYIVTGHSRLIYASCLEPDCEAELDETEMTRRLNATERLSPHLMGSLAYDRKLERYWRQAFAEYAQAMYGDDYQMPDEFAAALEEQDD